MRGIEREIRAANISDAPIGGPIMGTCDQCGARGVHVRTGAGYGEYVCLPCYDELVFTQVVDEPVTFAGPPEEALANLETHDFYFGPGDASDVRCWRCDCKSAHRASEYPCGAEVPRQVRRDSWYFGRLVRREITGPDGVTRVEVPR